MKVKQGQTIYSIKRTEKTDIAMGRREVNTHLITKIYVATNKEAKQINSHIAMFGRYDICKTMRKAISRTKQINGFCFYRDSDFSNLR